MNNHSDTCQGVGHIIQPPEDAKPRLTIMMRVVIDANQSCWFRFFNVRFGVSAAMGVEGTELAGQAAPWLMGQGREKASAVYLGSDGCIVVLPLVVLTLVDDDYVVVFLIISSFYSACVVRLPDVVGAVAQN